MTSQIPHNPHLTGPATTPLPTSALSPVRIFQLALVQVFVQQAYCLVREFSHSRYPLYLTEPRQLYRGTQSSYSLKVWIIFCVVYFKSTQWQRSREGYIFLIFSWWGNFGHYLPFSLSLGCNAAAEFVLLQPPQSVIP